MYSADSAFDLVLIGAGLQNVLVSLAVLARHPEAKLLLLEQSTQALGNHTWCFHAGDVPESALALIDEAVVARWEGYEVRFPDHQRRLSDTYQAITSDSLRELAARVFHRCPSAALMTEAVVVAASKQEVRLEDGRVLKARLVIDARGPTRAPDVPCAYQKFVGLEVQTKVPTRLSRPVLMDARVQQTDGFRFVYVLPLSEQKVLIEDTYFSDTPSLDVPRISREIETYAERHGIHFDNVLRTETGVLPMPLRSLSFEPREPFVAGYAGGFFHPATGYSFPVAMRLALHVAAHFDNPFSDCLRPLLVRHAAQFRFGVFLNRLLFNAFQPEERWNAMSRFYRLPVDVIRRFYALDTNLTDRARILCGRPPSGISVRTLLDRGALA